MESAPTRGKGQKSPGKTPAPRRGNLLTGNPGNAGGGRPPDAFKAALKAARDRPSVQKFLCECLDGDHGPQAMLKALEFTTDRVDGKVPQVTKLQGDEAEPLVIRVVRS